ncbi:MAG TPA: hypothetical protein VJ695_00740 [Nitrososphaera sp.]|nr:hypothetical protein [Nitrososphaera sp.]
MAQAQKGQLKHSRMVWLTTRPATAQKNLANSALSNTQQSTRNGKDIIIFHLGNGVAPTQAMVDSLKGVTKITDTRKGFEFFSLAEIDQHADYIRHQGFGLISYDLEVGKSPVGEVNDPLGSFRRARAIANREGISLMAAPSNAISSGQYAGGIAQLVDRYHLQSQFKQDNDNTCAIMKNWVEGRASIIKAANSRLEGKITFQVTLTGIVAPRDPDAFATAKRCIDAILPGDVDGVTIFWNGATWDNGKYDQLLRYVVYTYSL